MPSKQEPRLLLLAAIFIIIIIIIIILPVKLNVQPKP